MSERTIKVIPKHGDIWLCREDKQLFRLPQKEIDAIMEDIKNLR